MTGDCPAAPPRPRHHRPHRPDPPRDAARSRSRPGHHLGLLRTARPAPDGLLGTRPPRPRRSPTRPARLPSHRRRLKAFAIDISVVVGVFVLAFALGQVTDLPGSGLAVAAVVAWVYYVGATTWLMEGQSAGKTACELRVGPVGADHVPRTFRRPDLFADQRVVFDAHRDGRREIYAMEATDPTRPGSRSAKATTGAPSGHRMASPSRSPANATETRTSTWWTWRARRRRR